MSILEQLQKTLKQSGQSATTARFVVFEALQQSQPQTMQELITQCKQLDRASVYRTITLFETLGVVQRIQTGWKYKLELSDQFQEHHHHATCLHCGASIALAEDQQLEKQLGLLATKHGFQLTGHQIELQGICRQCLRR